MNYNADFTAKRKFKHLENETKNNLTSQITKLNLQLLNMNLNLNERHITPTLSGLKQLVIMCSEAEPNQLF